MTSTARRGVDPLRLKIGDVVGLAWDDLTEEEQKDAASSCHCSFLVEVNGTVDMPPTGRLVEVIAHDLKPGDIIRRTRYRDEEDGCHCDLYFHVERETS